MKKILNLLLLATGATVLGLSYNLFLIPHKIVPGGVGGLSMIIHHFFGLPIGMTSIVLNVPLFALGVKVLGRSFGVKSLVGVLVSALAIDLFTYIVPVEPATDDPILACVFGGIMLGAGLGLVFRAGGSTGGSDIVGQVLNRVTDLSTGSAILAVDFFIISAAGLAYGNFELALYGYVNLYLQTRVIDLVLEGISFTRALFVISDRAPEVARAITGQHHRGATLLKGMGAFTATDRTVVFSVMSKREVTRCRETIRHIDPAAFVIITDVYEVLGEGFHPRTGSGTPA